MKRCIRRVGRREQVAGRLRAEVRDASARNDATAIALAGSAARGDDGADVDCDIVADFDRGVTLFDMGGVKADPGDLLDAEVGVVPRSCLRDRYRTTLADATPMWAAATPSGSPTFWPRAAGLPRSSSWAEGNSTRTGSLSVLRELRAGGDRRSNRGP